MPRATRGTISGYVYLYKDMDRASWKVEIIASTDGVTYDVTDYLNNFSVNRIATLGLSNFSLNIDNNGGRYKNKFVAGDIVNIYYDFTVKANLTTIRFRGYVDGVFDNFSDNDGLFLTIDGRDSPKSSSTNDHFADTHITLQFTARNNLDCWAGVGGSQDGEDNYEGGVLYNSGMIFKVYDTNDSTWKVWKDLSAAQKDTLKAQTDYTQTHTNTYVDKSRLNMSMELAKEADYDFRIYYDSGDDNTYFMVHPEGAIENDGEYVTIKINLLSLSRYGKDTIEEFNRLKEIGFSDGNILLMRTKEDSTRQSALWIKDLEESTNALKTDEELSAKASARLNEKKEVPEKGSLTCCALPTLQPGEKIMINIPNTLALGKTKIKSFTISGGEDLRFSLDLQDRETRFEKIFKDRIDENVNITPSDNPNGMRNALVYDFSDGNDYTLSDCEINDEVLSLSSGQSTGTCVTETFIADEDTSVCELRIKAGQAWNCTYRVSNNNGTNYKSISPGTIINFSTTGKKMKLEVTLNESTTGVSPEFDKINLLYK